RNSQVARNPWTIDDQRHGNLVQFFQARGAFEYLPLFRQHDGSSNNLQHGIGAGRPSHGSAQRSFGTIAVQPGRPGSWSYGYPPSRWYSSLYSRSFSRSSLTPSPGLSGTRMAPLS